MSVVGFQSGSKMTTRLLPRDIEADSAHVRRHDKHEARVARVKVIDHLRAPSCRGFTVHAHVLILTTPGTFSPTSRPP